MDKKSILKEALIKSIPVFFSYIFLGTAYGMMMENAGFGFIYSGIASLFVYTGAFQFVMITFLSSSASLITVAVTALLMNSRQIFYAITYLEDFRSMGKRTPYMVHSLTDETFAVNSTLAEGESKKDLMYYVAIFCHSYWIIGSMLGGIIGQLIPWNIDGIDFCMTALFVIIFIDQWEKAKDHTGAIIGISSGLICLIVFGKTAFMLPALLISSAILMVLDGRRAE